VKANRVCKKNAEVSTEEHLLHHSALAPTFLLPGARFGCSAFVLLFANRFTSWHAVRTELKPSFLAEKRS
jgi:hypothetical protein